MIKLRMSQPVKTILPNPMPAPDTNSTAWPEAEMGATAGGTVRESAGIQRQLALLSDLEISLRASQQAVLGRDLEGLQRMTAEQARLRQTLAAMATSAADSSVRAAQQRVLHAGRVQLLLLGHAQRWLEVLTNVLAGSGAPYVPGGRALFAQTRSPGRLSLEKV